MMADNIFKDSGLSQKSKASLNGVWISNAYNIENKEIQRGIDFHNKEVVTDQVLFSNIVKRIRENSTEFVAMDAIKLSAYDTVSREFVTEEDTIGALYKEWFISLGTHENTIPVAEMLMKNFFFDIEFMDLEGLDLSFFNSGISLTKNFIFNIKEKEIIFMAGVYLRRHFYMDIMEAPRVRLRTQLISSKTVST